VELEVPRVRDVIHINDIGSTSSRAWCETSARGSRARLTVVMPRAEYA
jgi:hypothetical protein